MIMRRHRPFLVALACGTIMAAAAQAWATVEPGVRVTTYSNDGPIEHVWALGYWIQIVAGTAGLMAAATLAVYAVVALVDGVRAARRDYRTHGWEGLIIIEGRRGGK